MRNIDTKVFAEKIYGEPEGTKQIKDYDDIFLNICLVMVLILTIVVFVCINKKDFYTFFIEGDFIWASFAVFAGGFVKLTKQKIVYTPIKKVAFYLCVICCFASLGIYLAIKFSLIDNLIEKKQYIFWGSILMFIVSILSNVIIVDNLICENK